VEAGNKPSYEKYRVQKKNITYLKNFNGYVESDQSIEISSPVTGRLKVVNFHKNDHIEKGEVIFEIDDSQEKNSLSELQLNEKKTLNLIEKLRTEHSNALDLLAMGGISEIDTREILFNLEQAQLDVEILRGQIERAETNIEKYKITSAFSGVVASIDANESEFIKFGQVLASITDISRKKIKTHIDEFDGASIREGLRVRIIPMENGERQYAGVVSSIATFFESSKGLKKLEVTILPVDVDGLDNLKIGQNLRLEVLLAQANDVPVIEKKYLVSKSQKFYVKKLVDNEVLTIPIQVGIQNAHEVEIIQGLEVGDTVVLGPG
jgi:RND family efflux transporter MFP subunit